MTKMFYVCLRSNKRVERPSQPKLYSVSKLFRFRWAVFSLVYNLWNNKKRNTNRLGQVETLLCALLDDNFVFPVFCILRKIQKQGRKSIKTLSVFFTFEMRGLGNGSRYSVSGNKYFMAGNANKHWAASNSTLFEGHFPIYKTGRRKSTLHKYRDISTDIISLPRV